MKLAINQATTMKATFEQDVAAYAAAGFQAVELWLDKLTPYAEKGALGQARRLLDDHGLTAVSACYHAGVMLSRGEERARNLDQFRAKLELCHAMGCPVLIVPTDFPAGDVKREDYDRAAAGLAGAADVAAPYGISLAVEFIKGAKLIGSLQTTLRLVRAAGRPNVGALFDTFHFYAGVSKTEDILDAQPDELLFVHLNDVSDVPIEIARDSDRVPPGDGVMPLRTILEALAGAGYDGHLSVELFAEDLWAMSAHDAARLVYDRSAAFLEDLGL